MCKENKHAKIVSHVTFTRSGPKFSARLEFLQQHKLTWLEIPHGQKGKGAISWGSMKAQFWISSSRPLPWS